MTEPSFEPGLSLSSAPQTAAPEPDGALAKDYAQDEPTAGKTLPEPGKIMSANPDDDPSIPHDPSDVLRLLGELCKQSLAGGCKVKNNTIQGRGVSTPGMLLQVAGWILLAVSLFVHDMLWVAPAIILWLSGRLLWIRQGWKIDPVSCTLNIFSEQIPLDRLRPDAFGLVQIRNSNFWVHFSWHDKAKLIICFNNPAMTARFCRLFLRFCQLKGRSEQCR